MAEFVQTMKDWRRMCKEKRGMCKDCGLKAAGNECCAIYDGDMDYANVETVVTNWAAEHPEPKYPTWAEWLESVHVLTNNKSVTYKDGNVTYGTKYYQSVSPNTEFYQPIPADIAEKLEIEPKEKE